METVELFREGFEFAMLFSNCARLRLWSDIPRVDRGSMEVSKVKYQRNEYLWLGPAHRFYRTDILESKGASCKYSTSQSLSVSREK